MPAQLSQSYPAKPAQPSQVAEQASAGLPTPDAIRDEFNRINERFGSFVKDINDNRDLRRASTDVKALREAKKLAKHETLVQVRVIDENVERDKPTYIAYLKQSARFAIFTPRDGSVDPRTPALEAWFKTMICYDTPPWEYDFIMLIDGALTHGVDYIEVVYDPSKPGHVANNHVGVDRLIFDLDYDDIQQSPQVARGYRMSVIEIEGFRDRGLFKTAEADALIAHIKQASGSKYLTADSAPTLHKIYVKAGGAVYFIWYSSVTQTFLTELMPFYNGLNQAKEEQTMVQDPATFSMVPQKQVVIKPVQETVYPFVALRKKVTENKSLRKVTGHAHDSYYLQEAATSLTSSLINGTTMATNTMWSPDSDAGLEGSTVKQTEFVIQMNGVWNRKMTAFNPPYPDPSLIQTLQHLETRNAVATNNQAFAVQNRKDARKTAQELKMADAATSQVNSVQVLHLSICIREIAQRAFLIMQSEVRQNNLQLPPDLSPELFERLYTITSAGDTDYVERMEMIQKMQADLPMLGNTAMGPLLMEDYIRAQYPAQAERYIAALNQAKAQANADTQLIQGLSQLVQELAVDDQGQMVDDAVPYKDELAKLSQLVAQRLAQPVGGMAPAPANSAPPQ